MQEISVHSNYKNSSVPYFFYGLYDRLGSMLFNISHTFNTVVCSKHTKSRFRY